MLCTLLSWIWVAWMDLPGKLLRSGFQAWWESMMAMMISKDGWWSKGLKEIMLDHRADEEPIETKVLANIVSFSLFFLSRLTCMTMDQGLAPRQKLRRGGSLVLHDCSSVSCSAGTVEYRNSNFSISSQRETISSIVRASSEVAKQTECYPEPWHWQWWQIWNLNEAWTWRGPEWEIAR